MLGGANQKRRHLQPTMQEAFSNAVLRRVYEKYGQNLTRAAEALDVSRNTVRKYL